MILQLKVAANFREQKKHKLQRTFVSASDAAEDRAKGTKKRRSENSQSKNTVFVAAQHQDSSRKSLFNFIFCSFV